MADFIVNGVTYSGSPTNTANPQRPNSATRKIRKIGRTLTAVNGQTNYVHRALKYTWTLRWEKANQTTETAVALVRALTGTFSLTDHFGNSYTVVNVDEDELEEEITTNRSNAYLYNLELVLRQQ